MPKSRNRKNHKQKVISRNNLLKGIRRKMEAQYTEMMTQKLSELQSQFSGMSENESTEEPEFDSAGFTIEDREG